MVINHSEIKDLSEQLFEAETRKVFLNISSQVRVLTRHGRGRSGIHGSVEAVRDSILQIDNAIGGIGIDRLLVPTSDSYTGRYPVEERPIHRPLQYALRDMLLLNSPRTAVQMSCQHVEGILKNKYAGVIPGIDRKPMGRIVRLVNSMNLLGIEIVVQLDEVTTILNIAKHEYGSNAVRIPDPLGLVESQVFNIHEAVSMYFICRKLGVQLLANP